MMGMMADMARAPTMPMEKMLEFSPLSKGQQRHLAQVYALLASSVAVFAGTYYAFLNLVPPHSPIAATLSSPFLGLMASMVCLYQVNSGGKTQNVRVGFLMLFSCIASLSMCRYLSIVGEMYPGIISTAFLVTLCIFGSFSACALFSKERSWLYLGGVLGSLLFYLAIGSLINIFVRSVIMDNIMLYGSLLVYCGLILYDTQMAVEQYNRGNKDIVVSALSFFMNFIGIFIRVVRILQENAEKKKRNQ